MIIIQDTLQEVFNRASNSLEPGFIILGVSYQMFIQGVGNWQYMLAIARIGGEGTDETPGIIGTASTCFEKLPESGIIEKWMDDIQRQLVG